MGTAYSRAHGCRRGFDGIRAENVPMRHTSSAVRNVIETSNEVTDRDTTGASVMAPSTHPLMQQRRKRRKRNNEGKLVQHTSSSAQGAFTAGASGVKMPDKKASADASKASARTAAIAALKAEQKKTLHP